MDAISYSASHGLSHVKSTLRGIADSYLRDAGGQDKALSRADPAQGEIGHHDQTNKCQTGWSGRNELQGTTLG